MVATNQIFAWVFYLFYARTPPQNMTRVLDHRDNLGKRGKE